MPSKDDSPTKFKSDLRLAARDAGFERLVDLEEKTGLSHSTVSDAFNAARPLPSERTVHAIATATNEDTRRWTDRLGRLSPLHPSGNDEPAPSAPSPLPGDEQTAGVATESSPHGSELASGWPGLRSATRSHRGSLTVLVAGIVGIAAVVLVLHHRSHRPPGPSATFTETTGGASRTWSDYKTAGGTAGLALGPQQSIQVSCRVRGFVVPDHDPWWYRIESSPWDGKFYATSDAFYNNGATSGPLDNGVVVDEQVPECH